MNILLIIIVLGTLIIFPVVLYFIISHKRYKCQNGNCVEDSSGNYTSLDKCQTDCGQFITFYFEDGKMEKFPLKFHNKYYTKRGVERGCIDVNYKDTFKMKNDKPPIKFHTTTGALQFYMVGHNWMKNAPNDSCDNLKLKIRIDEKTMMSQDMRNLGVNSLMSNAIWENSFDYFEMLLF